MKVRIVNGLVEYKPRTIEITIETALEQEAFEHFCHVHEECECSNEVIDKTIKMGEVIGKEFSKVIE